MDGKVGERKRQVDKLEERFSKSAEETMSAVGTFFDAWKCQMRELFSGLVKQKANSGYDNFSLKFGMLKKL